MAQDYELIAAADLKHPVHVATTGGHSVVVAPGQTRRVNKAMAEAAAGIKGCRVQKIGSKQVTSDSMVEQRMAKTREAVAQLVESGSPDDFTQYGRPKKGAVRALVDFEVTIDEIDQAFQQVL